MSDAPWEPDRELTAAGARAAIESQLPDLAPVELEWLGAGWDNDVYASGAWVFRFPRRKAVADGIPHERAVLALAAERLRPLGLRVPTMEAVGRPGPHFPYPFSIAPRLPGVGGDRWRGPLRPELARQLGRALDALHATPEERFAPLGLQVQGDECEARDAELRARADEIRALLPPDLRARAEPWLSGKRATPEPYAGEPRLIHNDMADEHVLLDPGSGLATGLIDFADAALGDPMLDFVGLVVWLGPELARALIASTPRRDDAGFTTRLTCVARTLSLIWLSDDARKTGGRGRERHIAWIRNAFALPVALPDPRVR